jgi:hypothetical protein
VPFAFIGRRVEIRGAAGRVQILADQRVIAVHPRHTPERILIDPSHYDGPSTDRVQTPVFPAQSGRFRCPNDEGPGQLASMAASFCRRSPGFIPALRIASLT